MHGRVVVVGASVAGVSASTALRASGFGGEIVLVGEETHEPYDRPPLSKQLLCGSVSRDQVGLAAARGLDGASVVRRLGCRATRLDVEMGVVELDHVEELAFDGVVLATGSAARPLPFRGGTGVHVLRTLDDALALREEIVVARRVVIVGGGFIGLEVAASARSLGAHVTVIESASAPLARVLGAETAARFVEHHESHSVEIRCNTRVADLAFRDGRVSGVELSTGELVPADLVVVGIGAEPATAWLSTSRLTIDDGVLADATLQAAPRTYAAGDVVRWRHPLFGSIRVEHWMAAVEHGRAAAHNLAVELGVKAGSPETVAHIPYFWSDQYDVKIQMAGWPVGYDEVVELGPAGPGYRALFSRQGQVVAAMGWNEPGFVSQQRKAMADHPSAKELL